MRPGVEVISRAQPLPRTAPTDVGAAFMVGTTSLTSAGVQLVRSMTDYEAQYGSRTGATAAYDAADAYFREGGAKLTVSPVGSAAVTTPEEALDLLGKDLGPGQVFAAGGIQDVTLHTALLDHAAATNRIALLHTTDGDAASLEAAAAALQTETNARYGALFAPSAIIPGVTAGTTRSVPYDAVCAGIIARDAAVLNPNVPAAGDNGQAIFAIDLEARYTDAEYEALNEAGVDMARLIYAGVRTYGWRTLVDPDGPQAQWLDLSNARLNMAITAQAEMIGEHYVFAQLDGRGVTVAQFGADLRAMLVPFYEAGALYGDTAQDAFTVIVDGRVNTPETIANGELHAVMQVRMSPFSEKVVIEIVKVATTQAVAA